MLHVFGVQGNQGVLDLSQFASQNFHFVSEDLKIKSNTPQRSEIQDNYKNSTKKGAAHGKAAEEKQTSKPDDTGCVAMCMSCDTNQSENCAGTI